MLVLSRKAKESIQIGDNITITVVQIQGSKVRLGIEAPREVQVTRPDAKSQGPVEIELEAKPSSKIA